MADKSAQNLFDSIEQSRQAQLQRFIYALGIPGVGEEVAKLLARHFGSLAAFLSADWPALMADKEAVRKENAQRKKRGEPAMEVPLEGIGPELADAIGKFVQESHNLDVIARLGDAIRISAPARPARAAGKTFVLTVSLAGITRDEGRPALEARRHEVAGSVANNTDYLVAARQPGDHLER